MLRKLMKYEFRATGRIYLPMYALLILFAAVNRVFMAVNSSKFQFPDAGSNIAERAASIGQTISMTLYIFIIVGVFVVTFVVTIQRFYKNLLSDEGYLMFTLPVKTHQLISSKLIVAAVWNLLSIIAAILSVLVMVASADFFTSFGDVMRVLGQALSTYGAPAYALTLEFILLAFASLFGSIVMIYASIAVGHLCRKHRVMGALGAYLGFSVLEQIVASVVISIPAISWVLGSVGHEPSEMEVLGQAQIFMVIMILVTLVFGVVYFFLTNLILKKKLNLE